MKTCPRVECFEMNWDLHLLVCAERVPQVSPRSFRAVLIHQVKFLNLNLNLNNIINIIITIIIINNNNRSPSLTSFIASALCQNLLAVTAIAGPVASLGWRAKTWNSKMYPLWHSQTHARENILPVSLSLSLYLHMIYVCMFIPQYSYVR